MFVWWMPFVDEVEVEVVYMALRDPTELVQPTKVLVTCWWKS
jgi:hypothetical protein